jgi:hypothetical protein
MKKKHTRIHIKIELFHQISENKLKIIGKLKFHDRKGGFEQFVVDFEYP